jgi:hypothetical protein
MESVDQRLLDLLSEMLAVERDGTRLYRQFLLNAPEGLSQKLFEYAEQSHRSALVLEEAVRELGGDPDYVSPGAEVAHRLTEAVLAATEGTPRMWMYRLLHLIAFETRDKVVWESLDALADARGGHAGEVLRTAATAVLSDEALGAHMQDRNDERIEWALRAMQGELGDELGVELKPPGRRHGLHRPR